MKNLRTVSVELYICERPVCFKKVSDTLSFQELCIKEAGVCLLCGAITFYFALTYFISLWRESYGQQDLGRHFCKTNLEKESSIV